MSKTRKHLLGSHSNVQLMAKLRMDLFETARNKHKWQLTDSGACERCDSGEIQDISHVLDRCEAHDEARFRLHAETRIALKLGANAQVERKHEHRVALLEVGHY